MVIKTRFAPNDTVFVMFNNEVKPVTIEHITLLVRTDRYTDKRVSVEVDYSMTTDPNGGDTYRKRWSSKQVFESKKALLEHL